MKKLIFVSLLLCCISATQAQDFYAVNDSLLRENKLESVKKNSLAELEAHHDSIEANYFLAMVTIRQASEHSSTIFANNSYAETFQTLYRDQARARHLMHGDQIMVSDPRFVSLFYYLGLKYLSQNDFSRSVEWLNLAEIGYEDNLDFNVNLGNSYYAIKNYDKARKYYEAALRIDPEHTDTVYNMACLYSVRNNPDESVKWLEKAIKRAPKYKEIASRDPDFENIRKSKQYQHLMASK